MGTRPLTTLLALRKQAEKHAEQALAEAVQARAAIEDKLAAPRSASTAVADVQAQERWRARLRDGLRRARTAEQAARARHLETRRDRKALETWEARRQAEAERVSQRRTDDEASDLPRLGRR